jgi:hypothetical protein
MKGFDFYRSVATIGSEKKSCFLFSRKSSYVIDMLGSVRTITDGTGTVTKCYDYLPFGRMLSSGDNGRSAAGCHPANPNDLSASKVYERNSAGSFVAKAATEYKYDNPYTTGNVTKNGFGTAKGNRFCRLLVRRAI